MDRGNALSEAYIRVDTDLAKHVDATVSGTTAVTCAGEMLSHPVVVAAPLNDQRARASPRAVAGAS